jgi:hypothetical protein
MTPMVPGGFAFSTEALAQRWSWGRVMSRRSGGTWQRRWPRARKLGPAGTHKSLQAGTGANHSHSIMPGGFDVMSYATRLIPRIAS